VSQAITLYEIEDDLWALVNSEGLVPEEQEQAYRRDLAQALTVAADKRQRVGEFIRYCELMQENCSAEIARLEKLKRSWSTAEQRMRGYVVFTIESMGKDAKGKYPKLTGHTLTLSVEKNPDSVVIFDEERVPAEYAKLTVTVPADLWQRVVAAAEKDPALLEALRDATANAAKQFDKARIKKDIQNTGPVPGADLAFGKLRCKVT
jgi:hypothetical protein